MNGSGLESAAPNKNIQFMRPASRDSIFRVLLAISRREEKTLLLGRKTPRHRLGRRLLIELSVIPFVLALIFLGIDYVSNQPWLREPSLAALLIAYFGAVSQPLITILIHRKAFFAPIRDPFAVLLGNAMQTTTIDMKYIARLQSKPVAMLELVYLEVKSEREYFEKRISILIGAIDKIGLVPGLLAAVLSFSNPQLGVYSWWILPPAYATPVLYLFGAAAHFLVLRLDRMTKILELTVACAKTISSTATATTHLRKPRRAKPVKY